MASRIDYSMSVSAVQEVTHEGQTIGIIDQEIGRTLGGGNSSLAWDGGAIDAWAGGVFTYIEASTSNSAVAATGDNGVWIKHTGKAFDGTKTNNIDEATANVEPVTVKLAEVNLCTLGSGDCIFIPTPLGTINVVSGDDTGPAVEYAKLT